MKTYLTEHRLFKTKDTPRIKAKDFNDAVKRCPKELRVIGELIKEQKS